MKLSVKFSAILPILLFAFITGNCDKDRGFIIMPLSQEVQLGESLDSALKADPANYPVLSETANPEVYTFLNGLMNDILSNSAESLKYKDKFNWKITVIEKDVLNAFAAPGGKLYFYTGLLKYLDNTADLAGVLGHEMAHADLRHSARQMQKDYGLNIAAAIIFGKDQSALGQILVGIGTGVAGLKFSRDDELQADEFSVKYLSGTKYDPRGVAGFFEKLVKENNQNSGWEVLSTHPDSQSRVDQITAIWESLGKPSGSTFESEYINFKALLP